MPKDYNILVWGDFTSLYIKISNKEGISAIKHVYETYQQKL